MRYHILKIMVFPYIFNYGDIAFHSRKDMEKIMAFKMPRFTSAITMKSERTTVDSHITNDLILRLSGTTVMLVHERNRIINMSHCV